MNAVVAGLTVRSLLGRRRALLLAALPLLMLGLAALVRWQGSDDVARGMLTSFALGTVLPLLGLIIGTGAIGPEIDDGSIIYLLAKPVNRHSVVVSKLAVAVGLIWLLAGLPILLAGLLLPGIGTRTAIAFAVGAMASGAAYCALFLLLAVLTRNAVVIGLLYALVWESLVGQYVPGARAVSVQQWGLAVVNAIGRVTDLRPALGLAPSIVLLAVVTVVGTAYSGSRLRSLRLGGDE